MKQVKKMAGPLHVMEGGRITAGRIDHPAETRSGCSKLRDMTGRPKGIIEEQGPMAAMEEFSKQPMRQSQ